MAERRGSAMDLNWMGDKWFGQDVDKIFAYQTPRIVKIYDRTLGFVKNLLALLIFTYIFIFNIWYKGAHFSFSPVEGIARLQWQEPTKKCNPYHIDCEANFQSVVDLPYCTQYKGTQPAKVQKDCEYYDARELPISLMNGVLLPTYKLKYKQTRACHKDASQCAGKWTYDGEDGNPQTGTGYAKPNDKRFVADAEDFSLLIDHTFRTSNSKIRKDDFEMKGYWQNCNDDRTDCVTQPIKCVHKDCAKMGMHDGAAPSFLAFARSELNQTMHQPHAVTKRPAGRPERLAPDQERPDDEDNPFNLAAMGALQRGAKPSVIAITDGDVMSLTTLLAMAGKSLDETWEGAAGSTQSIRERGKALVVSIRYENLVRWTLFSPNDPPWYTISVQSMPADVFKQSFVQQIGADVREMELAYGTMVIVKQSGSLAFFDPMFALIALTSAMALLAVSSTLTELLMLNILPNKDKYEKLKFLESEDFHSSEKEAGSSGS